MKKVDVAANVTLGPRSAVKTGKGRIHLHPQAKLNLADAGSMNMKESSSLILRKEAGLSLGRGSGQKRFHWLVNMSTRSKYWT